MMDQHEVTLLITVLDDGEPAPAFWDWRAIMEDLVWDVEVKR